jgi:hypothetical protein
MPVRRLSDPGGLLLEINPVLFGADELSIY